MYFELSNKEIEKEVVLEINEVSTNQETEKDVPPPQKDPYWRDYNEFLVNLA